MIWSAAAFVVVAFLILLQALGVPRRAGEVVRRSRDALAMLRDQQRSDDEKEAAMQAHAKALFGQFFVITGAALLALLLPIGVVYLLEVFGVVQLDAVLERTLSWQILVGATIVGLLAMRLMRSRA